MTDSTNAIDNLQPGEQLSLLERLDDTLTPAPMHLKIRVSRRARNLSIQVYPHGGVEVVVPPRTGARTVRKFVTEHEGWIARARATMLRDRPAEPVLPEQIKLAATDETLQVEYTQQAQATIRQDGETLTVGVPQFELSVVGPALRAWLKRRARPLLRARLGELSLELGLRPKRLQIRLQKTRWGSCSGNGTISLNAALLLRPPPQLRYVLVHELCHLQHLNHSRRYWSLVAQHEPDYKRLDQALDQAWQASPAWLIF